MSSSKRIEDIDEDIVNYNADSDDDISKVQRIRYPMIPNQRINSDVDQLPT